jgi:hypothetical protein
VRAADDSSGVVRSGAVLVYYWRSLDKQVIRPDVFGCKLDNDAARVSKEA